jgi:predicted NodU family carbamoyl transferase
MAGGCALNIKWNTMIRRSEIFEDVWIPPFPNDSGAAIGTAYCELFHQRHAPALNWNMYSGPRISTGNVPPGWRARPCAEHELAQLLHREGEPVVVLSGRAEIGPRALGNRSILAPATDAAMQDRLNIVKNRAAYRPAANDRRHSGRRSGSHPDGLRADQWDTCVVQYERRSQRIRVLPRCRLGRALGRHPLYLVRQPAV